MVIQGGNTLPLPNLSNAPTMGPMPETTGSAIADFRNSEAPAGLGIAGMLAKGVIEDEFKNKIASIYHFISKNDTFVNSKKTYDVILVVEISVRSHLIWYAAMR